MAKLKFISGYLSEDDEWVIKSDCLRAGQLHYREIPYGEIIALEKKEGAGKLVFAELTLSNDKVVTAKLKENAYAKLYELFLQYGNKSTHPVKFPKERLSKSGVLAVIFSGFVVFSCVANSNNTSSSSGGLVTKSSDGIVSYSKKELCQG